MRRLIPRLGAASITFLAGVLAAAVWSPVAGLLTGLPWGSLLMLLSLVAATLWCFTLGMCGGAKKAVGGLPFALLMLAGGFFLLMGYVATLVEVFVELPGSRW